MVLEQQEQKPKDIPNVGRRRHIVTPDDLKEFIERYARIVLCTSTGQGTVYWYPGAKAAGQYVLIRDEKEKTQQEYRFNSLSAVLEAYSFGPPPLGEPDTLRHPATTDVHTRHCCISCGCKYGDEGCTVTTKTYKQEYDCTGECTW